jgi:hypothetical protein
MIIYITIITGPLMVVWGEEVGKVVWSRLLDVGDGVYWCRLYNNHHTNKS